MSTPPFQPGDEMHLAEYERSFRAAAVFQVNGIFMVKVLIEQDGLTAEAVLPAVFFRKA